MELPQIGGLEAAIGATGLLVLGYLASIWGKTRQMMIKLMSFIVVPQQITDFKLSMGVQTYLAKRGRRPVSRRYASVSLSIRSGRTSMLLLRLWLQTLQPYVV